MQEREEKDRKEKKDDLLFLVFSAENKTYIISSIWYVNKDYI